MARLNEVETRAYQRGIRDSVENKIRDRGETGFDVSRFVLGQSQKLKAAFGDKADDFIRSVKNERTLAQTENRVLGNSRTAFREAAGDDLAIDPSVFTDLALGNPRGVLAGLLRGGGAALRRPSQAVADELGPAMFTPGGQASVFNQLGQKASIQGVSDELKRELARVLLTPVGIEAGRATSQSTPQ